MTNLQKYNQAFIEAFDIAATDLDAQLVYQSIPGWDSVGHMNLMAKLEEAFNVMLEIDDIIDFSSYEKGKQILTKYEISIE